MDDNMDLMSSNNDGLVRIGRALVPSQLCGLSAVPDMSKFEYERVYYISDLHLETWYEKYCGKMSMSDFIETVVDSLFSGDFLQDIKTNVRFVVLFLGDISDSFEVSDMFYHAFVRKWDMVDDEKRRQFELRKEERKVQHEADVRMVAEYDAAHPWAPPKRRGPTWRARQEHNDGLPDEIKAAKRRIACIDSDLNREFHVPVRRIAAVLGNHEIDGFGDVGYDCGKLMYDELFRSLGIVFLDIGKSFVHGYQNVMFAGFCGFNDPRNGYPVIGNDEIRLREKQAEWYRYCVEYAASNEQVLVFCSHFPLLNGVTDSVCTGNVYHFCGHTHRNDIEVLSDNGAIIADNQVGYGWNSRNRFELKSLDLRAFYNPFGAYGDGCHEVKPKDYQLFSFYTREPVRGTKMIDNYLEGRGAFGRPVGDTGRFYMVKQRGYYGFFIVFERIGQVHICNGGQIRRVPGVETIDEVWNKFGIMINAYLSVFSGLRKYQEQIAYYVRRFGGGGKIHGLIVDIDFYNHVGIDPMTGSVTFYYSPTFGAVQEYSDMGALLEHHAPALYPAYKELSATGLVPYQPQEIAVEGELMDVPRGGNSFYGASKYMAPVQRLFSCNILRVWDEKVLNAVMPRLGDGDST